MIFGVFLWKLIIVVLRGTTVPAGLGYHWIGITILLLYPLNLFIKFVWFWIVLRCQGYMVMLQNNILWRIKYLAEQLQYCYTNLRII